MRKIINQPTYKRQRFLLAFIRQINGSVAATDLQKLVFLNTMATDSGHFEFIPYKYGPYSFQLAEDIDILNKQGYISMEYNHESIRILAVGKYPQENSFQIASERGNNLISKAYREYPYYAINSEIISRLFHGDELARFQNGRQALIKKEHSLFTIGYEGKSIEGFINILIQNDVRLLCDIRKNPLSRKFGFSKSKLEHIVQTVGIKYVHIPDLGITSDKRRSLDTIEDYQRLFDDYANMLSSHKELIEETNLLLKTNVRIALMCYERNANMCHRHVLRDYMTKYYQVRSEDI